jgi:dTDP-4-dehydrorhamnose 3,5-epimerase-like enzyme
VVQGEIQDIAVDIRPDSKSFGRWVQARLSGEDHRQIYIPPGFAHGFSVLSEQASVWYKTTDVYRPEESAGRPRPCMVGVGPIVSARSHPPEASIKRSRPAAATS